MYKLRHWIGGTPKHRCFALNHNDQLRPTVVYAIGRGLLIEQTALLPTQLVYIQYADTHVTTTSIWQAPPCMNSDIGLATLHESNTSSSPRAEAYNHS